MIGTLIILSIIIVIALFLAGYTDLAHALGGIIFWIIIIILIIAAIIVGGFFILMLWASRS